MGNQRCSPKRCTSVQTGSEPLSGKIRIGAPNRPNLVRSEAKNRTARYGWVDSTVAVAYVIRTRFALAFPDLRLLPRCYPLKKNGRDDWIRTSDPLTPSQVRSQAAPHSDAQLYSESSSLGIAVAFRGRLRAIQNLAHLARQPVGREGLRKKRLVNIHISGLSCQSGREPRHEQHLYRRPPAHETTRQFRPAHLPHDDIGKEKIDPRPMTLFDCERLDAVRRDQHVVAVARQGSLNNLTQPGFVIGDQNRLGAVQRCVR